MILSKRQRALYLSLKHFFKVTCNALNREIERKGLLQNIGNGQKDCMIMDKHE